MGGSSSRTNSLLEFKQIEQEVQEAINGEEAQEETENEASIKSDPPLTPTPADSTADAMERGVDDGIFNPVDPQPTRVESTDAAGESVQVKKQDTVLASGNDDVASTRTLIGSPTPESDRPVGDLADVPASELLYNQAESQIDSQQYVSL